MSNNNQTDPVEQLFKLQRSFKSKLPLKIADIESNWRNIRDNKSPDFVDLHLKLHSLVGTAGTFGAFVVSNTSREIETLVKSLLKNDLTLNHDVAKKVDTLLYQLRDVSEKWQPSSIPFIPEVQVEEVNEEANWQPNIYLVEDDVEIVNSIIDYLELAGYKVFYYRKIKEFEYAYSSDERASAIIMDMQFEEGHIAGAETIQRLSEKYKNFPPVVFISVHLDIQARLAAAQAGAKRYFTKPINQQKLLSCLDKLTNRIKPEAYRILLIDDEQEVLDFYSTILKQHGVEVLSFTSPIKAYQPIESFKPDLIILDLYMPECSGLDFASVIRQNDDYAHIPIVFLSSELDAGTQLAAMDLGGDDFLMKPVDPEHFIQAVTARVKRSRHVYQLNKTLQDTLRESEYRLITLDQHAIVCMADKKGNITLVNEHFLNISGYNEKELIGKNLRTVKSMKHPDVFREEMWNTISNGKIWNGQICNEAKDGTEYWVEATIVPFMSENGLPYKYVSVGTDITKIKKAEEDAHASEVALMTAKDEAESANQAKSKFLSNMSHELRTPMNAISGFAQLLLMDSENIYDDVQRGNIEEIIKASNHLLELISEILELSKIESGQIKLSLETVNYSQVAVESISLINTLAKDKGITLIFIIEGKRISFKDLINSGVNIFVDRTRFKQVLLNLLSNAIKYNNKNGSITISGEKINNNFRISVIDTGIGISKADQKDLFKSFNRLGKEDSGIEGTGIGLVITRNIVELMEGEIGVESELGKGTTFWIEFPLV